MNALAPIAPKLGKLILLLSSPHDGEVVSSARAIERSLKAVGLDFHALVGALVGEAELVEPQSWRELARWCRDHDSGQLSIKERAFVRDMTHRLVCDGKPTEKQAGWLRAIYTKLRGAN